MACATSISMRRPARSSAILEDNEDRMSRIFSKEASRMITLTAISGPKVRAPKTVTMEDCSEAISITAFDRYRSCKVTGLILGGGSSTDCQRITSNSDIGTQEGLGEAASTITKDNAI